MGISWFLVEDDPIFVRMLGFPAEDDAVFPRMLGYPPEEDAFFARFTWYKAKGTSCPVPNGTLFARFLWFLANDLAFFPRIRYEEFLFFLSQKLGRSRIVVANFPGSSGNLSRQLVSFRWFITHFRGSILSFEYDNFLVFDGFMRDFILLARNPLYSRDLSQRPRELVSLNLLHRPNQPWKLSSGSWNNRNVGRLLGELLGCWWWW